MNSNIIGMLYIVDLRMLSHDNERIKKKILLVGGEVADIERKIKWNFDLSKYKEFSIKSIEKVREKIHVISTSITREDQVLCDHVIERRHGSQNIKQPISYDNNKAFNLYAVGVTTTMYAIDSDHAMRKVGSALVSLGSNGKHDKDGNLLSKESTVVVEEIAVPSSYARARDVSNEINSATFVRG